MKTFHALAKVSLADELIAHEPPEARGIARDGVRLVVSEIRRDRITHTRFQSLPGFLRGGDVIVVNTSATVNAALEGERQAGTGERNPVLVHLSMPIGESRWIIELRRIIAHDSAPLFDASAGERVDLLDGGRVRLVEPYRTNDVTSDRVRLWLAEMDVPDGVSRFAARFGSPIRYSYVQQRWPLAYYQTLFSREPGSAEMPSAGRPFTPEVVARLSSVGVRIAPVVLHTGVSSLEADEPPYPERFRVPAATARIVNETRGAGGRVIAVGTTVARALETVAENDGLVRPGHGWTDLVVSQERGVRAIDGLITGLHAPGASHLSLLEAFAPRDHLARAYDEAIARGYLWHEFGDSHLIVP